MVEEWIELPVQRMVQDPITHARFVDIARLRIVDLEGFIFAMLIGLVPQLPMKRKDVVHQAMLEFLHIILLSLTAHELLPCGEQILDRNDILVGMSELNPPRPPPPARILPVLERIKQSYILWHEYHSTLPKIHRYSLGNRIDSLFIEAVEAVSAAAFLGRDEKIPYVRLAARKIDALKLLLMVLWETKSLEPKKYTALSEKMDEIGKMLGGWSGQLKKQNSPARAEEKRRE